MMETKTVKKVPYGISDFRRIMTEIYAYVDKNGLSRNWKGNPFGEGLGVR
jgi:hypothetical protein